MNKKHLCLIRIRFVYNAPRGGELSDRILRPDNLIAFWFIKYRKFFSIILSFLSRVPLARARLQTSLQTEDISSFVTSSSISVRDRRTFSICDISLVFISSTYFPIGFAASFNHPINQTAKLLTTSCSTSSRDRLKGGGGAGTDTGAERGLESVDIRWSGEPASLKRDLRGLTTTSGLFSVSLSASLSVALNPSSDSASGSSSESVSCGRIEEER